MNWSILITIMPALVTGIFGVITSVVSYRLGRSKNHEKIQSKALNLLLHSQTWCLRAFQQLKNPDSGEPLINGESHKLLKEIEVFQRELIEDSLSK